MRPDQIKKAADEFDISAGSAIRMRIRYLLALIDQWHEYIEGNTDNLPPSTICIALDEIVGLKNYEARAKKGPVKGGINDEMVERARAYPIENVVEFIRGVSTAWCHTDKTPSLTWDRKRNRAHCFPCGEDFSALDVLILRDGYTFIDAVKHLVGQS